MLSPIEPLFGEQNKDSIVVKLTYLNVSFMLMGDADEQTEHRLLPISSIWPQADVLKIGHHGSRYSSTGEWLDAVQPSVAIVSAGYQNRYGHPHNETLERLQARNITVFRTDIHPEFIDDIVATTDGYSLIIRQPSTGNTWAIPETMLLVFITVILLTVATMRKEVLHKNRQ